MPPLLALCHLLTKPKGAEPCEGVLSPWGQAESPGFGISLPGRGPHAGLVRLTWAGLWPWVALWQGLWLGEQTGPLLSSVAPSLLSRWSPGGWGGGLTGLHITSAIMGMCLAASPCATGLAAPGSQKNQDLARIWAVLCEHWPRTALACPPLARGQSKHILTQCLCPHPTGPLPEPVANGDMEKVRASS